MPSFPCLQDVDEFFQTERDHNLVLTGYTKTAAEVIEIVFPFLLSHADTQSCLIFECVTSNFLVGPTEIPGCGAN